MVATWQSCLVMAAVHIVAKHLVLSWLNTICKYIIVSRNLNKENKKHTKKKKKTGKKKHTKSLRHKMHLKPMSVLYTPPPV